ncbi:uncharacterized protein Tco025E_08156 [Trypanosoma conorhini]|uniref:Uncharacterized protein n=1 Tax=Trypanosoma conorhini TaxID=83891 RepID=A0A422NDY8_9TRYP|nr:uncharacterized protein Tco025E_08156 [Trypanosoma conorhini]RNF03602.1 hypothetical protein Tco025E_08156 [Trypanosoma conorhini]
MGVGFTFEPLKLALQIGRVDLWYGVEKDGFSSLLANVSAFAFATDYVEGGVLTALLPGGIQCSTRRTANDATSVAVSVGALEAAWKVAVTQTLLLHAVGVQVNVSGDAMYAAAQNCQLLGAVRFAPMKAFYRRELSSVPTTARPYLASSLQFCMCLAEVCMDRLALLELDLLGTLMSGYTTFFVNEVVSTRAYQLFFSGFSNIAVSVSASSCPVTLAGAAALVCRVSVPPVTAASVGTPLRGFGELLPELRDTSPLTLVNACERLLATVTVPCLEVEVFHCRFASIRLRGTVCSFTATLPIAVEEFWDDDVRAMERPSVELVVPSVKVNAGDAIRLEVEGAKCTMHSLSSLGESSVTFSDYEVDSDTLSAVGEEAVRVEVMAWKLHLNGVPAADVASAMLGLWSELGVMAMRRCGRRGRTLARVFLLASTLRGLAKGASLSGCDGGAVPLSPLLSGLVRGTLCSAFLTGAPSLYFIITFCFALSQLDGGCLACSRVPRRRLSAGFFCFWVSLLCACCVPLCRPPACGLRWTPLSLSLSFAECGCVGPRVSV